ncbi:MAG: hypothetical protein KA952_03970 [Sediminibacterium sp.]|nr:hypothetical protein [Sediminibacterium sp.]
MKDHLGNTRLVYSDTNNDGIITVNTEILQESHYYPFGLEFQGHYIQQSGYDYRYKYNDIERLKDLDIGIDMAYYRGMDPTTGRWMQVDPKAEYLNGLSPYCAMNNNPITFYDPNGDLAPLVWAGIAVAGGALNVWNNWDHIQNGGGWSAGLKAFGVGAAAAVVGTLAAPTAAVGGTLAATVSSYAVAGTVAGSVGGAIQGFGNSVFFSDGNIGDHLAAGVKNGIIGGISGAAFGAAFGAGAHWFSKLPKAIPDTKLPSTTTGNGINTIDEYSIHSKGGHHGDLSGVLLDEYVVTATKPGTFSISNWFGYPKGLLIPKGPFRLIEGLEYKKALELKEIANKAYRKQYNIGSEFEVHEIHPVKFGGSPTDPLNKTVLHKDFHRGTVTPWWNRLKGQIKKL